MAWMGKGKEYNGEDGVCRLFSNRLGDDDGLSIDSRWRDAMELVEIY